MIEFRVLVAGQPKGEVYKKNRRYWWRRPNGSTEPFAPGHDLDVVINWIARCYRSRDTEVRLHKIIHHTG